MCCQDLNTRCSLSLLKELLKEGLSLVGCWRVESVADVTAGQWFDALPIASNCLLGDRYVASSLQYMLGLCTAVMQDITLVSECAQPLSQGQAMMCR